MMRLVRTSKWRSIVAIALVVLLLPSGMAYAEGEPDLPGLMREVILTEEEAELFDLILQVKEWIMEFSPKDVTLEELYDGALAGMIDAINDPFSQHLNKEEYEGMTSSLQGEYVGIGVTIDLIDGHITVINTFRGSPAESAGIKAGDIIVSAGGEDLTGKTQYDAQVLLRGEAGTEVAVTIRRPSDGTTTELTLLRQVINQDSIEVKALGDGLHYIRIPQFTVQSANEFEAVMGYLRTTGMTGLVLDLRDNPGGLVDACMRVAAQLVPKGLVAELRRKELRDRLETEAEPPSIVPVAVLVNGGSASCSEILAGAIRDRGAGILVGETTFGKASIQVVAPLDRGTGLRLTIADYYTPSGYNLADKGLEPDISASAPEITPPTSLTYKRPLASGLVGLDVLALQEGLAFLGYATGEPDGLFGAGTASAIDAFFVDRGLARDGIFDASDAERLSAAIFDATQNGPDEALAKGLEALKVKIATGAWPVSTQPGTQ